MLNSNDEVILLLNSPGGAVDSYGLASSQLLSLRECTQNVTVCVDKIAASGGYMMAATATRIVAAPFARVGSIGVITSVVNYYKGLQKLGIDGRVFTSVEDKVSCDFRYSQVSVVYYSLQCIVRLL